MKLNEDWMAVVLGFLFMIVITSGMLVKVPW